MCGLMYHIYSMCYNQLQSKLAFKEAMEDRAKDVVRKLLEEHTVVKNTHTHAQFILISNQKMKIQVI